ncbi:MAG: hypothetical protein ACLQG3_04940 [Terracidiphilus sp.]
MAHLWTRGTSGWDAQMLDDVGIDVAALATSSAPEVLPAKKVARLLRTDSGGSKLWALIASGDCDVRVNSRSVSAGLCVLSDRDEIRIGAEVQYFSTEALAAVVAFPAFDRPVFCGRCRQQIEAGAPAVCCPGCGIWYNQSADLPCWTYSEKCAFCGHPTALDAGFTWTPEAD